MASSVTEVVAWWGAVLSTIVFVWDIIKWRLTGPRLRFSVQSNMKSINLPEYEGKTLIHAEVVNHGDRATTITHLCFLFYKNIWNRIRDRADYSSIVGTPSTTQRIPYELKPGGVWSGIAIQNERIERMAREGYLLGVVYHSDRKRPIKQRVIIEKK